MRLYTRALSASVLALSLIVGPIAGSALAGKGGKPVTGGGSSTLSLIVVEPTDGPAQYGGKVTFDVSTTATDQPLVQLDCYQGGVKVYWASAGFYPEYPWQWAQTFTLKSNHWTGGAADCTATLYMNDGRRFRNLMSIGFPVAA